MAKLRRSAHRPGPAKKARATAPLVKSKGKPAARKTARKPVKPAARKVARAKSPTRIAARRASKPGARRAAAPPTKARSKPVVAAPPPRRSTYADAVVLYERGLQALQAKRYRDAAVILKRVIAEYPEEVELHERAQLYIRVCERHVAPPDATPKTPEEQVYAATLAINAGAPDRAVALLTAALHQHKDNDSAEYMLGIALSLKGDQQGAIAHLTRAVELNPDTRELLRKEPELEALRQTDDLKTLLAAPPAPGRKERRPQARPRR